MGKRWKPYLKNVSLPLILCPLTVIGEVLLEIMIPFYMAKIIDVGIAAGDMAYIYRTGGQMILMALVSLLLGVLAGRFAAVASMGFGRNLRKGLFDQVQNFSFYNIDQFSTASLVTRLTTDVTNIQNAFMMTIRVLVRAPFMLISATIMAFRISSSLVNIFFVAVPVLAVALFAIIRTAFPRFQVMLKKYDAMNSSVQENLIAIRVIKAFVRSDHEKKKFAASADDVMQSQLAAEKIIIMNMPLMQFVMYACMIAIVWFGGNMIMVGAMKTGELMSFISYVTQILMSLMMISMVFVNLVLSRASLARITQVLDETPDIHDGAKGDPTVQSGEIVFEDVSFGYRKDKGNLVLENVDLTIHAGETIGIIGGTGSGKSSLVQLIPRLYDPAAGRVLVGGRDVKEYSLNTLRDAVSMVLQKNVLFSGTIKDNLKWGKEDATDEEIIAAAKAAQAHDFIMSFPGGYDTDLGQGGVNVSGGQKQRLCIARALLKHPKVIILDDSTSAVDTATDAKIRQAFREQLQGTTAIIIAQRVSSIMDADRIIVMDDGRIDAVGTHEQLLRHNQIYQEVYASQQEGEE